MTREEILEKSRRQNKGMDEREQQVRIWAGKVSQSFGVILCLLVSTANMLFDGPRMVTIAVLMVYTGMGVSQYIASAFRLKKPLDCVMALFLSSVFVLAAVKYLELLTQGA